MPTAFTALCAPPRGRARIRTALTCTAAPRARSGDAVCVHVRATLLNGTVLTDRPVSFTLGRGQTQPEFEAAVVGLRRGETRRVRVRATPRRRALIHTDATLDGVLTNGLIARQGDANHAHAGRIHDLTLKLEALNHRVLPRVDGEWALFAGGSFWALALAMRRVRGVKRVVTGYAGGHLRNATYIEVASGRSGHAETVAVSGGDYGELLDTFWAHLGDAAHTQDRCGNDVGTQYRSAVFCASERQLLLATKSFADVNAIRGRRVVTKLHRYDPRRFVVAEDVHQHFLEDRGQSPAVGVSTPIARYG